MIGIVIGELLTSSEALTVLVGDKIYPYVIPEETILPAIVYSISNTTPEYTKDGWFMDTIEAEILSISDSYMKCLLISDEVRKAVELQGGLIENQNIISIRISSITEGLEIDSNTYFTKTILTIKKQ